jgi:hypothetical protein
MDMSNLTTPREIDMALAAKHHELDKAEQQVAYSDSEMLRLADAKYYYRGRKRVTDMTLEAAMKIVKERLLTLCVHMDANAYVDGTYHGVNWDGYNGAIPPYNASKALKVFDKRNERLAEVDRIWGEINDLNSLYTGWSRFFLVTSSPGHVHSSMHCSSCRPTTTYGWMPELSGKDEATAVKELGPTLCSVCFTSAPTEHIGGKITAAKAAKLAA